MSPLHSFSTGMGAGKDEARSSDCCSNFPVQASRAEAQVQLPHYPSNRFPRPTSAPTI